MGLFSRAAEIIQAKTHAVLNGMENTDETLDLSYEKMIGALQDVKRHTADVVAERISLDQQIAACQKNMTRSEADAKLALQDNREELAKQALLAKTAEATKLASLQQAHDGIAAQEAKLADYCAKMQQRIDAFRTQKEVLKAQNSAASAQVKVTESLSGIGSTRGNAGDALQRAQDKTQAMQAKAAALDSMMASGVLSDPLDHRSQVEKELDQLHASSSVDDDLARLKAEMNPPAVASNDKAV
ncbi:PspA/IM30 family protein [Thiomonas sp.]